MRRTRWIVAVTGLGMLATALTGTTAAASTSASSDYHRPPSVTKHDDGKRHHGDRYKPVKHDDKRHDDKRHDDKRHDDKRHDDKRHDDKYKPVKHDDRKHHDRKDGKHDRCSSEDLVLRAKAGSRGKVILIAEFKDDRCDHVRGHAVLYREDRNGKLVYVATTSRRDDDTYRFEVPDKRATYRVVVKHDDKRDHDKRDHDKRDHDKRDHDKRDHDKHYKSA